MNFPSKIVENAVERLSSLPGIGRKSALRLVLHMLKKDKLTVEKFGDAFIKLINNMSNFIHVIILMQVFKLFWNNAFK